MHVQENHKCTWLVVIMTENLCVQSTAVWKEKIKGRQSISKEKPTFSFFFFCFVSNTNTFIRTFIFYYSPKTRFCFSKRFFAITETRIPARLGERLWEQKKEGNKKKNQFKADLWISFCPYPLFFHQCGRNYVQQKWWLWSIKLHDLADMKTWHIRQLRAVDIKMQF